MSTPFASEIRMFAGNFAPRLFAFCDGRQIPIQQNTLLFSLIGTIYGGNGATTFALPDLRGRVPVGMGQGAGLPAVQQGQLLGSEQEVLNNSQMPVHGHSPQASLNAASAAFGPPAAPGVASTPLYDGSAATSTIGQSGVSGGSQAHPNMAPSLALNFVIALEGIFPSRN